MTFKRPLLFAPGYLKSYYDSDVFENILMFYLKKKLYHYKNQSIHHYGVVFNPYTKVALLYKNDVHLNLEFEFKNNSICTSVTCLN